MYCVYARLVDILFALFIHLNRANVNVRFVKCTVHLLKVVKGEDFEDFTVFSALHVFLWAEPLAEGIGRCLMGVKGMSEMT